MKKFLKILLICMILGFLLFVGLALWLLSAIFDSKPAPLPPMGFKQETVMELTQKAETIGRQLYTSKPDEIKELRLNADELNTLMLIAKTFSEGKLSSFADLATLATADGSKPTSGEFSMNYKEGAFYFYFARETGIWTPFGSYVNGSIIAAPELSESGQKLGIRELRVGSLNLPTSFIENNAQQKAPAWLSEALGDDKDKRPIVEFRAVPPNGEELLIRYRPFVIAKLLQNYLQDQLNKQQK